MARQRRVGWQADALGGARTLVGAIVALGVLAAPSAATAGALYKHIGPDGSVHFTNVPNDARFERFYLKRVGYQEDGVRRGVPNRVAFDRVIRKAARRYRLEPALVKAVIRAESNFEPAAVSHAGAIGLMQLMPKTARAMGVSDPREPRDNILGGARYLRSMIDRYDGDLRLALAAYNAGPTAVDRHRGVPPYRETQTYVTRVLAFYDGYHARSGR